MFSQNTFVLTVIFLIIYNSVADAWLYDSERCSIILGQPSICVDVNQCPHIWQNQKLEKHFCHNRKKQEFICCPYQTASIVEEKNDAVLPSETALPSIYKKNECGVHSVDGTIFGGQKAEIFEFPWMALLRYHKKYTKKTDFLCQGSIINMNYILTAAHCTDEDTFGRYYLLSVRLGERDIRDSLEFECFTNKSKINCVPPKTEYTYSDIIIHPEFSYGYKVHDIALIRLDRPIKYTRAIRPICLPIFPSLEEIDARRAWVVGWGQVQEHVRSTTLLKAKVFIHKMEKCRQSYDLDFNETTHICAGGKVKNTCKGDSGGPLQILLDVNGSYKFLQVGISSFGAHVCGQKPTLFVKVYSYIEWILDTVEPVE